jgi:hypothetical protein
MRPIYPRGPISAIIITIGFIWLWVSLAQRGEWGILAVMFAVGGLGVIVNWIHGRPE